MCAVHAGIKDPGEKHSEKQEKGSFACKLKTHKESKLKWYTAERKSSSSFGRKIATLTNKQCFVCHQHGILLSDH